jgi:LmbE family N-acetylglucosaminyl deacetylase
MKTLVIAPHPDDESIGCGGTIALGTAAGDQAVVVFLTSGELGLEELAVDEARAIRESEAEAAGAILGLTDLRFLRYPDWFVSGCSADVAKALSQVMEQEAPDRLLVPHPDEWHPDHAAAAAIVFDAVKLVGAETIRLLTYEVWTPMSRFEEIEDISAVMGTKLEAVRAYRSQLATFDYCDAVEGLDRFRGALGARCRYAEVFGEPET